MIALKNVNHTFDVEVGDVGCTIRKGPKWSEVPIGEPLCLMYCLRPHQGACDESCEHRGGGRVVGSWLGKLKDLPSTLLKMEHNRQARNKEVLISMLRAGYGRISDDDIITALVYFRAS